MNQSTYIYSQALLHACMGGPAGPALQRLSQESAVACSSRGTRVSRYNLLIKGASQHPEVVGAISTILENPKLDAGAVRTIYDQYVEHCFIPNFDDRFSLLFFFFVVVVF